MLIKTYHDNEMMRKKISRAKRSYSSSDQPTTIRKYVVWSYPYTLHRKNFPFTKIQPHFTHRKGDEVIQKNTNIKTILHVLQREFLREFYNSKTNALSLQNNVDQEFFKSKQTKDRWFCENTRWKAQNLSSPKNYGKICSNFYTPFVKIYQSLGKDFTRKRQIFLL